MLSDIDLDRILDPDARALTVRLLNVVEALSAEVRTLREENQRLHDEINRLKGEQGKPAILPQLPPQARRTNRSSEAERREPREHRKGGKQARLTITRQEVLRVDRRTLPPDAVRKGYADVVFRTDTIRFRKEQWYARSTGQTYLAPLPPGYSGQFGPGLKSLALSWYYGGQMSEAKIAEVFEDIGIVISAGQLSNLLIKGQEQWHTEAEAIYRAGLASTPWQHLDERPTRVNGRNEHCHVLGNPLYTAYHTTPGKDRLSVLDVLRNRQQHTFRLNAEALGYLDEVGLAQWIRAGLAVAVQRQDLGERDWTRCSRRTCRGSVPSSASGSWTPPPWPPTTPNWRSRWSGCWSVTTRPSSPGSPSSWRSAGSTMVATTRSWNRPCPPSAATTGPTTGSCWPIASSRRQPNGSAWPLASTRCSAR